MMAQTLAAACMTVLVGWVGFGAMLASAPTEHLPANHPHSHYLN